MAVFVTAPWWWAIGCVYDPDDRCSPGQVVIEHDRCACAPGLVAIDGVCQGCPENELEQNGACVCVEGYVRDGAGLPCLEAAPGLGIECSDDTDCTEDPFTYCRPDPAGDYCTSSDCSSSDDCSGGYACDSDETPAYCMRPPLGQSAPCASDDDCADYEADFCVPVGNVCLVQGCGDGSVECFEGWTCCDLSSFGQPTLCLPEGECPI
jgi:hypothetical protein